MGCLVGIYLCPSPHHATSVPLILSTQTSLVSPHFHCIFDDNFETVRKEVQDTSVLQCKAHIQHNEETIRGTTSCDQLVAQNRSTPSLSHYGNDIPQALLHLPKFLNQATTGQPPVTGTPTEEPPQLEGGVLGNTHSPTAAGPSNMTAPTMENTTTTSFPVNIAPTGQTQTGQHVCLPMQFGFAANHCYTLAPSAITSITDYHPLTLLQMFVSSTKQPEEYLDDMPWYISLQQPDQDKFSDAVV